MSENQINLFIFDRDPIFRLGLCTAIADYREFSLAFVTATTEELFDTLEQSITPDILIIGWSYENLEENYCEQLCQQLLASYPDLVIFLLASGLANQELEKIQGLATKLEVIII